MEWTIYIVESGPSYGHIPDCLQKDSSFLRFVSKYNYKNNYLPSMYLLRGDSESLTI